MRDQFERLDRILGEIGRMDGIENLRLSPSGTAALQYKTGGRVLFEYVEARAKLYLYTPLAPIPADPVRRALLLEIMLDCNFLRLHTGAGEFAFARSIGQAVYQVELDVAGLDAASLDKAIGELLEQREECLYRLQCGGERQTCSAGGRKAVSTMRLIAGGAVRPPRFG